MSGFAKNVGALAAIVAFVAGLLLALLRDCPPLMAARKAALCAAGLGLVAWLCADIAVGVVEEGLRKAAEEESGS